MKVVIDGEKIKLELEGDCNRSFDKGNLRINEDSNIVYFNLESAFLERVFCHPNRNKPNKVRVTIEVI